MNGYGMETSCLIPIHELGMKVDIEFMRVYALHSHDRPISLGCCVDIDTAQIDKDEEMKNKMWVDVVASRLSHAYGTESIINDTVTDIEMIVRGSRALTVYCSYSVRSKQHDLKDAHNVHHAH